VSVALQDYAYTRSNFAFSPYGVASVLVVLYEGARGEAARQIHNTLRLPWNVDVTRIGFRDIHRHLRVSISEDIRIMHTSQSLRAWNVMGGWIWLLYWKGLDRKKSCFQDTITLLLQLFINRWDSPHWWNSVSWVDMQS
jgi:hypothetical protein